LPLGASFSPLRAAAAGLDWRKAFADLLALDLDPIRLSAYWDSIDRDGYGDLDWLLAAAAGAGRSVVLTAGMKAMGWPEFYIPARLVPSAPSGGEIGAASPALADAAVEFVVATVERYRNHPALAMWQVENEPLNRSGPSRWWISPQLLERELAAVRQSDPGRTVMLNAFAHFNWLIDRRSNPSGQGIGRLLDLLPGPGVLGLDVYIRMGERLLWWDWVWRADGSWASDAGRWLAEAESRGREAWAAEAQAEPWGPGSVQPADIRTVVEGLRSAGYHTILLWGTEHWLAQAAKGDRSWLDEVAALPRTP
jgi:hypothetical protein